MPNLTNLGREERMDKMGIPYQNIYPELKYRYISAEEKNRFPERFNLPNISAYYKELFGNEILPFYYQPIIGADFESFVLRTGRNIASDTNHIYQLFRKDIPITKGNTRNYDILETDGIIYYPFYKIIRKLIEIFPKHLFSPYGE